MRRCLGCIRELVSNKQLDLGVSNVRDGEVHELILTQEYNGSLTLNTAATLQFEILLNQLIAVGEPGARSIECTSAGQASAADIYLYWLATMASIKDVLGDEGLGIPTYVADEVRGIVNARWREFFLEGPTQLHLAAFYLHPGMLPRYAIFICA